MGDTDSMDDICSQMWHLLLCHPLANVNHTDGMVVWQLHMGDTLKMQNLPTITGNSKSDTYTKV